MGDYINKRAIHKLIDNREYDLANPVQKKLFHNAVNNLPLADVPHWIPCSEKVPEIEVGKGYTTVKAYLVTMLRATKDKKTSGAMVDIARFMPDLKDGEWQGGTWRNDWLVSNEKYDTEVIAWMPIPKPYNPYTVSGARMDGEQND